MVIENVEKMKRKIESVLEDRLVWGAVKLSDFVEFCEALVENNEAVEVFKEKLKEKLKKKLEEENENLEEFLRGIDNFIDEIVKRCEEFIEDLEFKRIRMIYEEVAKTEMLILELFTFEIYNILFFIYIEKEKHLEMRAAKEQDGKITEYKNLLEFFIDLYVELRFNEMI